MGIRIVDSASQPWLPHRTYIGVYARSIVDSDTSAELEVKVLRIAPGAQVPPHTHEHSAETKYVLSGEGAFLVGDEWVPCHRGYCAHARSGTAHGSKNTGDEDLYILAIFTPPLG